MSLFKPEFCYPNFADIKQYTSPAAAITFDAAWTTASRPYLYDHRSDLLTVTAGANSDATSVSIVFDLGAAKNVGLVKILNTNAENIAITYGTTSACSTGTLASTSTLALPYYNALVTSGSTGATQCTQTFNADGSDTITASGSGTKYFLNYRYWKVTITHTQTANAEKYIGEVYIGRQMVQLSGIRRYKQSQQDDKEQVLKDFYGVPTYNTVYPVFSAEMAFSRPSDKTLFTRAKSLILYRNNYDFFPTSTLMDDDVSFDMSGSDIWLVTTRGSWNYTSYGQEATGQFDILITETKFIY